MSIIIVIVGKQTMKRGPFPSDLMFFSHGRARKNRTVVILDKFKEETLY